MLVLLSLMLVLLKQRPQLWPASRVAQTRLLQSWPRNSNDQISEGPRELRRKPSGAAAALPGVSRWSSDVLLVY